MHRTGVAQGLLGVVLMGMAVHVCAMPVPSAYQSTAQAYALPPRVLYAIALTESRRQIRDGIVRPWPWTLNIRGTPHFFPNRKAAYRALRTALADGIRNVDIGLMQVNWRWHHERLGDPWQALDPYHNLRVGAAILHQERRETDDLWQAVGRYHSRNPARALAYRERVADALRRVQKG